MDENETLLPPPEELTCLAETLREKAVYVSEGTLYVVATPIGRIVDITLRAAKILEGVDLVAAEDTRRAYILLNCLGIRKEVVSNQKFNEHRKTAFFLEALSSGKSVAVISDAGTPCVSDPGNELVKAAIAAGIPVVPVPGACAAVTAASASGFDLRSFLFCGFFPKENSEKRAEKKRLLSGVAKTYIYYESPRRILKTAAFFAEEAIPCRLLIANDLTKTHERFYRGTPEEVLAELRANPNAEKGEFVIIAEPAAPATEEKARPSSPGAALCEKMLAENLSARDAIAALTAEDPTLRRNDLKDAAIRLKGLFGG